MIITIFACRTLVTEIVHAIVNVYFTIVSGKTNAAFAFVWAHVVFTCTIFTKCRAKQFAFVNVILTTIPLIQVLVSKFKLHLCSKVPVNPDGHLHLASINCCDSKSHAASRHIPPFEHVFRPRMQSLSGSSQSWPLKPLGQMHLLWKL